MGEGILIFHICENLNIVAILGTVTEAEATVPEAWLTCGCWEWVGGWVNTIPGKVLWSGKKSEPVNIQTHRSQHFVSMYLLRRKSNQINGKQLQYNQAPQIIK